MSEVFAKFAQLGDLDGLLVRIDELPEADRDAAAYKWLSVALDYGHDAADTLIEDLLESSTLRFDDDQFETGNAHWELAIAYLSATEGLPRDLQKGRDHLDLAVERSFPLSVEEGEDMIANARAKLDGDARAVLDLAYPEED